MHKPGFQEQSCYQMLIRMKLCRAERHSTVNEKTSQYLPSGFQILKISTIKIYMYIYTVTPSREKLKSILLTKMLLHINCVVYFSLFFITTVCEHRTEDPSYHHRIGSSFSKLTSLKVISLSFSPQVTLCFTHLVFSLSDGWKCLQLKQAHQESQTCTDSFVYPEKKGAPDQSRFLQEGILYIFFFL